MGSKFCTPCNGWDDGEDAVLHDGERTVNIFFYKGEEGVEVVVDIVDAKYEGTRISRFFFGQCERKVCPVIRAGAVGIFLARHLHI